MNTMDRAFIRAYRSDARAKQGGRCKYCGDRLTAKDATADHVVPRKRGGANSRENIVAACRPCNKAKGHLSENQYKKRLREPETGAPWGVILCHVSWRLNRAVSRSSKRILTAAR